MPWDSRKNALKAVHARTRKETTKVDGMPHARGPLQCERPPPRSCGRCAGPPTPNLSNPKFAHLLLLNWANEHAIVDGGHLQSQGCPPAEVSAGKGLANV